MMHVQKSDLKTSSLESERNQDRWEMKPEEKTSASRVRSMIDSVLWKVPKCRPERQEEGSSPDHSVPLSACRCVLFSCCHDFAAGGLESCRSLLPQNQLCSSRKFLTSGLPTGSLPSSFSSHGCFSMDPEVNLKQSGFLSSPPPQTAPNNVSILIFQTSLEV